MALPMAYMLQHNLATLAAVMSDEWFQAMYGMYTDTRVTCMMLQKCDMYIITLHHTFGNPVQPQYYLSTGWCPSNNPGPSTNAAAGFMVD